MYWTFVWYVLNLCLICTGLLPDMYWTSVWYVLDDFCLICTGLLSDMYWTSVWYVLDFCLICLDFCLICTRLLSDMYWTSGWYGLDFCLICTGLLSDMYWISVWYVLVLVVHLRPVKGSRCFLEQETLPLLLITGWFQERIRTWFPLTKMACFTIELN